MKIRKKTVSAYALLGAILTMALGGVLVDGPASAVDQDNDSNVVDGVRYTDEALEIIKLNDYMSKIDDSDSQFRVKPAPIMQPRANSKPQVFAAPGSDNFGGVIVSNPKTSMFPEDADGSSSSKPMTGSASHIENTMNIKMPANAKLGDKFYLEVDNIWLFKPMYNYPLNLTYDGQRYHVGWMRTPWTATCPNNNVNYGQNKACGYFKTDDGKNSDKRKTQLLEIELGGVGISSDITNEMVASSVGELEFTTQPYDINGVGGTIKKVPYGIYNNKGQSVVPTSDLYSRVADAYSPNPMISVSPIVFDIVNSPGFPARSKAIAGVRAHAYTGAWDKSKPYTVTFSSNVARPVCNFAPGSTVNDPAGNNNWNPLQDESTPQNKGAFVQYVINPPYYNTMSPENYSVSNIRVDSCTVSSNGKSGSITVTIPANAPNVPADAAYAMIRTLWVGVNSDEPGIIKISSNSVTQWNGEREKDVPVAGIYLTKDNEPPITVIPQNYSLRIVKEYSGDPNIKQHKVGDIIDYRLRTTVGQALNVTDINITDDLPPELDYVSSSNNGSYDASTHRISWPTIPMGIPGQEFVYTIKAKVRQLTPEPEDVYTVKNWGRVRAFEVCNDSKEATSQDPNIYIFGDCNDDVDRVIPPRPSKTLTTENGEAIVAPDENLASGSTYLARVKAMAGVDGSNLWIKDTISPSDGVFVGGKNEDDTSRIYVEDASGNKVPATISVDRSTSEVVVTAALSNVKAGTYVLVVPQTTTPTGSDYDLVDTPTACWDTPDSCSTGDSKEVHKVTPAPEKHWYIVEDGKLVFGSIADGQGFSRGDEIGAAVDGKISKNMLENLQDYAIADDWTDNAKYVDFSDVSKAFVLVDGENQTSQFDITLNGTTTIATAKPSFLANTVKLGKERKIQLAIVGKFKDFDEATNTHGNKIVLTNTGWERWNNETIPTEKPPVFIWDPDPEKEVIGDPNNGGQDENINDQMVFPGQSLKYQIKLDTHIPEGMAYDIDTFGAIDYYDPLFIPDRQSIEATGRNGVIPKKNYTVTWDDNDPRNFKLLFKKEFIESYLKEYAYGQDGKPVPDQDGRRYITITFTGKVSDEVLPGSTVKNKAVQLFNKSVIPTPEPNVNIPPTEPDKEVLGCDNKDIETGLLSECADINGKTVVKGDKIDYRILMDARPAASKFAYIVHKLGMFDQPMIKIGDADAVSAIGSGYLSLNPKDIKVTVASVGSDAKDKFTEGQDVTDMFNVSVENNTAYIFAKTVDTPDSREEGKIISGDPQPASLEAYNKATIDPLNNPGIDQDLLGNTYWIYLRTTVEKETGDSTIENEATQNFENMYTFTKQVVNPLTELKPEKEANVVVGGENMNGKEIPINSNFVYTLRSSLIPANRAYKTTEWNIVDNYPVDYDVYTGQWIIKAQTDIYRNETLVAKKGDIIASSKYALSYDAGANLTSQIKMILGTDSTNTVKELLGEDKLAEIGQVTASLTNSKIKSSEWVKEVQKIVGEKTQAEIKKLIGPMKSFQLTNLFKNVDNIPELATSVEGEDGIPEFQNSFDVVDQNGKLTVTAKKDSYFDVINSRLDIEQGWEAIVQFTRIKTGDAIRNSFTENYNQTPREPEEVVTKTPENPGIEVVKYELAKGHEKGVSPTVDKDGKPGVVTELKNGKDIKIGFKITNTGDVPLVNVKLTDNIISGSGKIKDITCKPELTDTLIFMPGDVSNCEGLLTGLKPGEKHKDTATVTGESIYSGKKVTDKSSWVATVYKPTPNKPSPLAKTGAAGIGLLAFGAVALTGIGVATVMASKKKRVNK